jgi:hypothetical protein
MSPSKRELEEALGRKVRARARALEVFTRAAASVQVGAEFSPLLAQEIVSAIGTLAGLHVIPGKTLDLAQRLELAFETACQVAERE